MEKRGKKLVFEVIIGGIELFVAFFLVMNFEFLSIRTMSYFLLLTMVLGFGIICFLSGKLTLLAFNFIRKGN